MKATHSDWVVAGDGHSSGERQHKIERMGHKHQKFGAMLRLKSMIVSLASFWRRGTPAERTGYVAGALLMISGLIHLVILMIAGGSWEGPLSLRKPTTFGLSFGLTLMTIVWVTEFLQLKKRTRAVLLAGFILACTFETTLVSLQTWRGVPSHFNIATAFDALVARSLAAGGAVLVVITAGFTLVSFRANLKVPISLRIAIRAGFIVLLGAQMVGAVMIAKGMLLVFRGDPQAAYDHGGSLKLTHGTMMHGVLMLPALAWLLSFSCWSERRRVSLVSVATGGYLILIGVAATADLGGRSPLQLSPAIAALSALAAISLLVTGVLTLVGVARAPVRDGIRHG
jgi:hypothetical protein